jgi:hypothetical protein
LGYIHKLRAYEDLLPAIDAVLAGKRFISTGLDFIEGPRHHEILFCSDNEAILDSLARFIAAALNANNPAIVHVTEANRISLLQKLRMQVDIDSAIRNGTYVSSETSEKPDLVRMRQAINAVREAASKAGKKHARVAVCGERAGRLWANGQADEAIRLEQLCNQLAQDDDVDILCPYPAPYDREDDPALKRICAEHSAVSFR